MRPIFALSFLAMMASAQTDRTGPDISAYYRLPETVAPYPYRWMRIDKPLNVTVDQIGNPHLGISMPVTAGKGIIVFLDHSSGASQVMIDSAYVTYRQAEIPSPGKCDAGTGAWAGDQHYFYYCAQDVTGNGFVWVRVAGETNWTSTQRCTQDALGNVTCSSTPAPPIEVVYVAETDEIPTYATGTAGDAPVGRWILLYVPEQALACTRNGVAQTSGVEYSTNGNELISGIWQADDVIKCSYQRRQ